MSTLKLPMKDMQRRVRAAIAYKTYPHKLHERKKLIPIEQKNTCAWFTDYPALFFHLNDKEEFSSAIKVASETDSLIHAAAASKSLHAMRKMIKEKINLNAKCPNGESPLMYAIRSNSTGMVLLLLKNGADVYAKDKDNVNALQVAMAVADAQIVLAILDYYHDSKLTITDARKLYQFSMFDQSLLSVVKPTIQSVALRKKIGHLGVVSTKKKM